MATVSSEPICVWWPQAWTACVSGSAKGWPGTMSESSSPNTPTVGPELPPVIMPLSPVMARPSSKGIPSLDNFFATNREVRCSRNPGSGVLRMCLATSRASSARRSIWTSTAALVSWRSIRVPFSVVLAGTYLTIRIGEVQQQNSTGYAKARAQKECRPFGRAAVGAGLKPAPTSGCTRPIFEEMTTVASPSMPGRGSGRSCTSSSGCLGCACCRCRPRSRKPLWCLRSRRGSGSWACCERCCDAIAFRGICR